MLTVHCPQCQGKFAVRPEFAGKVMKCPACGGGITVPAAELTELVEVIGEANPGQAGRHAAPRRLAWWIGGGALLAALVAAAVVYFAPSLIRPGDSALEQRAQLRPFDSQKPVVPLPEKTTPVPEASSQQKEKASDSSGAAKSDGKQPEPPMPKEVAKPKTVADLIDQVQDGVVLVSASEFEDEHFDLDSQGVRFGSGFVVDRAGLIATNYHVISKARVARVQFRDGTNVLVRGLRACDEKGDLAILELAELPKKPLTVLELATDANIRQGDEVIAMGHPQGFRFTVSNGIVSAVRKTEDLDEEIREFLKSWPDSQWVQSTAAISGGNSGGPLLSRDGKVVGVNTWGARGQNLGFAAHVRHLVDVRRNLAEKAVGFNEAREEFIDAQRAIHYRIVEQRLLPRLDARAAHNRATAKHVLTANATVDIMTSDGDFKRVEGSANHGLPLGPFAVRGVTLRNRPESFKELTILNNLEQLEELDFLSPDYGDREIIGLTNLPKLQRLTLRGTLVTDASLPQIGKYVSLQRLDLAGTKISDFGVAELSALPALTFVDLSRTPITDACGGKLGNCKALSAVNLSETAVTDTILASLKDLSSISLADTGITDRGLEAMAKFPNLATLDISKTKITDDALRLIASMPNLKSLSLRGFVVGDAAVEHLMKSGQLRFLHLGDGMIVQENFDRLKKSLPMCNIRSVLKPSSQLSPKLPPFTAERTARHRAICERAAKDGARSFVFVMNRDGAKHGGGADSPEKLPQKDNFVLLGVNYPADPTVGEIRDLSYLNGLETLLSLYFGEGVLGDAAIESLQNLPSLHSLTVGICPKLTAAGVSRLREFPQLHALSVSGAGINGKGFAALKSIAELKELRLAYMEINDDGMREISDLKLEELYLSGIRLTDNGAQDLKKMSTLRRLRGHQLPIKDDLSRDIKAALPKCHTTFDK